jgi:hypothetical protein
VVVTRIPKSGTLFGDSGPMIAARSVEEAAPVIDGLVSGFQTAPPDLELVSRTEDSDIDESRVLSCSSGSSRSSPEWVRVSSPLPNDKQLHRNTETTSSAEPSSIEGSCAVSPNALLSSTSSGTVFSPPSLSSGFNSSLASAALPAPVFVASSSDAAAALALESVRVASSPDPSAAAAATPASNLGSVSTQIFATSSSVSLHTLLAQESNYNEAVVACDDAVPALRQLWPDQDLQPLLDSLRSSRDMIIVEACRASSHRAAGVLREGRLWPSPDAHSLVQRLQQVPAGVAAPAQEAASWVQAAQSRSTPHASEDLFDSAIRACDDAVPALRQLWPDQDLQPLLDSLRSSRDMIIVEACRASSHRAAGVLREGRLWPSPDVKDLTLLLSRS